MEDLSPHDAAARRRSISPLLIDSPSQLNHPKQNKISEIFENDQFIPYIDTIEIDKHEEEFNLKRNLKIKIEMAKKRKSKILDDVEFREAYGFVRRKSLSKTQIIKLNRKVRLL